MDRDDYYVRREDMDSSGRLRDLALWAAGARVEPEFASIDVETALTMLDRHRLTARLLYRAQETGVELPPELDERLRSAVAQIERRTFEQIDLFNSLDAEFSSCVSGGGVLPVKGFTLFAHTGERTHLRRSGDIDIVGSDAATLARLIAARDDNGSYHYHGEDHPYVFAHMRDFEVHMWYLVSGFPADQAPSDFDATGIDGPVELVRPFSVSRITYDEMATSATSVQVGGRTVRTLGLPVALLIRCAHIYVGYAMNPRPVPYATVRLEELCQVIDLTALDSFDHDAFWREVDARDAWLVVDFVRRVTVDLLGRDPFPETAPPARHDWFPTNLWWDGIGSGFPVRLPWAPSELVVRSQDAPRLDEILGANAVPVLGGRATLALTDAPESASDRYFYHRFGGGMGDALLGVEMSDSHLTIRADVRATASDWMSMLGVECGDYRYESFYKPADDVAEIGDYSEDRIPRTAIVSTGASKGGRHEVVITLPWAGVGRQGPLRAAETMSMIVRVRQQQRPWGAISGGYVVPIQLVGQDNQ